MPNNVYPVAGGATLAQPVYPVAIGASYPLAAAVDPRESLVGGVIKDFARDIKGGFNVASATAGEFGSLLGLAAPMTWEDLSTRDVKGALMLAALGVGGWAGGAVRGLLPAGTSALGRAGSMAGAEAVAGAAMGLIRPLEEDESRLNAVFGDAAFTGAFGAGLSFAKSGIKATIGARIAQINKQAEYVRYGQSLQHKESSDLIKETAGTVLLNPATGSKQIIRRTATGSIERTLIDSSGAATEEATETTFGQVLARAVESGYTENLGIFDSSLVSFIEGQVDDATLKLFKDAGSDVAAAFGPVKLGEYASVRQALKHMYDSGAELGSLAGEVASLTTELGAPALKKNTRIALLKEMSIPLGSTLERQLSDGDVMREAFRRGLIDVNTTQAGMTLDAFARDLFLSDLAPVVDIQVIPRIDAIGTSLLLPRRLAKMFPEFAPVQAEADARLNLLDEALAVFDQRISNLRQTIPAPVMEKVAEIIDSTTVAGDLAASRAAAQAVAASTNNPLIQQGVEQVTGMLAEYLQRGQAAGVLGEGLSGYFPLVVANKWKLDIKGLSKQELADAGVKLFYPKKAEAEAAVAALRAKGKQITYELSPQQFWNPEVFTDTAGGVAKRRSAMQAAYKTTPFAKQRTLGIRDFSEDAYTSLEIYGRSMERTIALRDFERVVEPLVARIPDSQPRLKAAAEQLVADVLGRPRPSEQTFQAVLEHIGYDAPPRALKKYTTALRRWESAFRLGGPFSAIINLTQVATNTYPVLGLKYTAAGLEPFSSPSAYKRVVETLHRNGVNLGLMVPFTDTGAMTATFGTTRALFKEKRYVDALHRMSLSLFLGAEKANRLTTAWGAFKKGIAEGMDEKAAAGYAQSIVERAQFNYRLSNTPELLRSPVGALLFQFKSYVINELDFIASLNKQEALRFGAAVWGLGGLALFMNMPGTDMINAASTFFFDRKISEAAALQADEGVAQRGFFYGLPGLLNTDMSDYVGVGSISEVTQGVLGPAAGDAKHLYDFIKGAAVDIKSNGFISGQTASAFVQSTAPSAVRRALRGYDIYSTGEVRNPYTGKLVYRPQQRMRTAVAQTLGFPALEMTQQRAADMIVTRVRDDYIRGRTTFAKQAAQAIREGNSAEAGRIMQEANASGFELDQRTIKYWVKEMSRDAAQRRERRTPQALRAEYAELFEATGTLEGP